MSKARTVAASVILGVAGLLSACGGDGDEATPTVPYDPVIDPADFTNSTVIDNPYLPMVPGTTFVYEGDDEGEFVRIEEHITDRTKVVMGITVRVVNANEWVDGELEEVTDDWYAQDNDGNIWYFGEDTKELDKGEVVTTEGSWEAGVDGALPGILMHAAPHPDLGDYRQEFYAGEAEDMARVIDLNGSESVAYGAFDGLLVTREWTPLEPGVAEQKYYKAGVGLILETMVEGGEARVELIEILTQR